MNIRYTACIHLPFMNNLTVCLTRVFEMKRGSRTGSKSQSHRAWGKDSTNNMLDIIMNQTQHIQSTNSMLLNKVLQDKTEDGNIIKQEQHDSGSQEGNASGLIAHVKDKLKNATPQYRDYFKNLCDRVISASDGPGGQQPIEIKQEPEEGKQSELTPDNTHKAHSKVADATHQGSCEERSLAGQKKKALSIKPTLCRMSR